MERCPQCRARLKNSTSCGRCGVDLQLLMAVETEAEMMARKAVASLKAGDIEATRQQAEHANQLHATLFHQTLLAFSRRL